jgi:predicted nucleotidyltransferase
VIDLQTRVIIEIATQYPSISKIVLFGSRARGTFTRTSDFDICAFCSDSREFARFYFDLDDMDTIYTMNILRYEEITNRTLKEEITRDGVVLYERE